MTKFPENSTLALPGADRDAHPLRDRSRGSKEGWSSSCGSMAEMRLSICIWLVNTSRSNLFSAAMSSCGLPDNSYCLLATITRSSAKTGLEIRQTFVECQL